LIGVILRRFMARSWSTLATHATVGPFAFALVVYPSSMKPLHELTLAEIVAAIVHITGEIECLRDAKAPEHEIDTIGALLRALSQERRRRLH
jgi:hypothetical protein